MPLQPVIRQHVITPVNTPNPGTPIESALDAVHLSHTLANSHAHRVGGGYETTTLAAGMESSRLHDKNQFRGMDDQSFNTTLVNYLDQQHRTDATNADMTALMDPRSRNTHFVQVYEQSAHEWQDRHSPKRNAAAHSAANSMLQGNTRNNNTTLRPSSALNRSGRSMNRSTANASHQRRANSSASGYKNTAPTNVKGLFVAFADSTVEEHMFNLSREVENLNVEKETDHYNHRTELARYIAENNRMKEEHAKMKETVDTLDDRHGLELKEMRVLKEEYEGRYRQQMVENAEMQKRLKVAEDTAQQLKDGDGGRLFQIQSLQYQLQECGNALRRAEDQATDSAKRARQMFDEKELLKKKSDDMELERHNMKNASDTKEKIIAGLEKELVQAQEKLSSIAFFKENYGGNSKSSAGSPGGRGAAGKSSSSSKLYDKFYGRGNSKTKK